MTPLRAYRLLLAALLVGGVLGGGLLVGCERPFVEEAPPRITIVAPDLSEVRADPNVEVVLEVESSLRAIDTVRVNGRGATFDAETGAYRLNVTLERGLNTLRIEAIDDLGNLSRATRFGVFLPARFRSAAQPSGQVLALPDPVGGHAATRLADGRVLITGGARTPDGEATDGAFLLDVQAGTFETLDATMQEARVGHTASLLADGRVLIVGGARTAEPTELSQLVNAPELFDPATGTFTRLTTEVTTPPYERTEHAAHAVNVDGRTFVYLIGGRGRISLTGTTLGTRSDFRIGELVPVGDGATLRNTLAIGPDLARSPQAVSSFTFTPTGPLDGQGFGDFILAGTYTRELDVQLVEPVALAVTLAQDPSYDDVPVSPMTTDRSGHAAALIEPGLVLAAGGQVLGTGAPIPEAEVFAAEAQQFFPFPLKNGAPRLLIGRYGHTATKLDDGRILFLGGFNADGTATALAEFFELP